MRSLSSYQMASMASIMTDLYLIAHRVRGEPAFDIAIMLDALDEDGDVVWLIPTSGHRAYPWWYIELGAGVYTTRELTVFDLCPSMPPSHPDHYACNDRSTTTTKQPTLLSRLNLHRTQPPIIRRI